MRRSNSAVWFLGFALCLLLVTGFAAKAQNPGSNSNAPAASPQTGRYEAMQSPIRIALNLATNGTYEVCFYDQTNAVVRGAWRWDAARGEFSLTPQAAAQPAQVQVVFDFRRLRVDPQDASRLQWLPFKTSPGGGAGALDYVTLKRKVD